MTTFSLTDVVERAFQHPGTFLIPGPDERTGLEGGDLAKLVWESPPPDPWGERMWVEVMERDGDGYLGELRNTPVDVPLQWGAEVRFGPEHVASIIRGWRRQVEDIVRPGGEGTA